ncbi:MAG: hypothetical protein ACKPKO_32960, partial [Candidatus Fonsibacter sp.]
GVVRRRSCWSKAGLLSLVHSAASGYWSNVMLSMWLMKVVPMRLLAHLEESVGLGAVRLCPPVESTCTKGGCAKVLLYQVGEEGGRLWRLAR